MQSWALEELQYADLGAGCMILLQPGNCYAHNPLLEKILQLVDKA